MMNNECGIWLASLSLPLLYAILLAYFLIFFYCASQMPNPLEDWTACSWSSAFHHHLLSLTKHLQTYCFTPWVNQAPTLVPWLEP